MAPHVSRTGSALEEAVEAFRVGCTPWTVVEVTDREDDMATVVVWIRVHDSLIYEGTYHVFASGSAQLVHSSM